MIKSTMKKIVLSMLFCCSLSSVFAGFSENGMGGGIDQEQMQAFQMLSYYVSMVVSEQQGLSFSEKDRTKIIEEVAKAGGFKIVLEFIHYITEQSEKMRKLSDSSAFCEKYQNVFNYIMLLSGAWDGGVQVLTYVDPNNKVTKGVGCAVAGVATVPYVVLKLIDESKKGKMQAIAEEIHQDHMSNGQEFFYESVKGEELRKIIEKVIAEFIATAAPKKKKKQNAAASVPTTEQKVSQEEESSIRE